MDRRNPAFLAERIPASGFTRWCDCFVEAKGSRCEQLRAKRLVLRRLQHIEFDMDYKLTTPMSHVLLAHRCLLNVSVALVILPCSHGPRMGIALTVSSLLNRAPSTHALTFSKRFYLCLCSRRNSPLQGCSLVGRPPVSSFMIFCIASRVLATEESSYTIYFPSSLSPPRCKGWCRVTSGH